MSFASLHLVLHALVPAAVAVGFFRKHWQRAYLVMLATMAVDLDHLLADPIYDPTRCSIGFHPLHEPLLIVLYVAFCVFPATRYIGVGLLIHMALDATDCRLGSGVWFV